MGLPIMESSPEDIEAQQPSFRASARFANALSILLEAYNYARELDRSVWDFAVEIGTLRRAGLSKSDLRWLVCKDVVAHAAETTSAGASGRTFSQTGILTFRKSTCFVLTDNGALLLGHGDNGTSKANGLAFPQLEVAAPSVPEWDREQQQLRVGKLIVKQFKVPAPNQTVILEAFQEEGWPVRIDDPLPRHAGQDAKRRLNDTITTLNRHHACRLIRFAGDGSGEGIRWMFISTECPTNRIA
jgi:hypothetical protein